MKNVDGAMHPGYHLKLIMKYCIAHVFQLCSTHYTVTDEEFFEKYLCNQGI